MSPNVSGTILLPSLLLLVLTPRALAVDPVFTNQTVNAGVAFSHNTTGFPLNDYSGGGSVGDFNNDGWQDLFMISGGSNNKPDYLFINNGNGTFTDQAAAWGLTLLHKGKGCCVGDFDRDGWLDLFVTSAGPVGQSAAPGHNKLYRNLGGTGFSNVAAAAGVNFANPTSQDSWGACFGDYDLDGDLDLYVGGFNTGSPSNNGNHIYKNNGNGTFTDVTASIGLFSGVGAVANLSQAFIDMDGDRYPELLLGGDFKGAGTFVGSRYFKNDGDGTFTDMTVASGTGIEENGMGQCRGDFNNDGRPDWYVTSIYLTGAGWTGNKLYRNLSNHHYGEGAVGTGCADGGYGWGSVMVDFNHDGFLDIAETNGDATPGSQFWNEQSYLWVSNATPTFGFTERAISSGFVHYNKGRCLINFDYDNDGDQDMALFENKGELDLFRNDLVPSATNHWLRVFLDTNGDLTKAPNGYGAKIQITIGVVSRFAWIDGGSTFLGVSELSAHFGLGSAALVDSITVHWPDGALTVVQNVAADQTITIASIPPKSTCPEDLDGDSAVDGADAGLLLAAWGTDGGDSKPSADLNEDGIVDGADYGLMLGAWGECK